MSILCQLRETNTEIIYLMLMMDFITTWNEHQNNAFNGTLCILCHHVKQTPEYAITWQNVKEQEIPKMTQHKQKNEMRSDWGWPKIRKNSLIFMRMIVVVTILSHIFKLRDSDYYWSIWYFLWDLLQKWSNFHEHLILIYIVISI